MPTKYNIKFGKLWEIDPYIEKCNENYSFLRILVHFFDKNKLLMIFDSSNEYFKEINNGFKEYISSGQQFIRIWQDKVEFGQYDDNFFHEMEQFKDYVDEGEKIFGNIPTEDFIGIVKEWRDFVIKCEEEKK